MIVLSFPGVRIGAGCAPRHPDSRAPLGRPSLWLQTGAAQVALLCPLEAWRPRSRPVYRSPDAAWALHSRRDAALMSQADVQALLAAQAGMPLGTPFAGLEPPQWRRRPEARPEPRPVRKRGGDARWRPALVPERTVPVVHVRSGGNALTEVARLSHGMALSSDECARAGLRPGTVLLARDWGPRLPPLEHLRLPLRRLGVAGSGTVWALPPAEHARLLARHGRGEAAD